MLKSFSFLPFRKLSMPKNLYTVSSNVYISPEVVSVQYSQLTAADFNRILQLALWQLGGRRRHFFIIEILFSELEIEIIEMDAKEANAKGGLEERLATGRTNYKEMALKKLPNHLAV